MTTSDRCTRTGLDKLRIGIDFDNTIASYDELMHEIAVGWGLIDAGQRRNKKSVRDQLRLWPEGENHWRRLQTYAYGEGMSRARQMEGVKDFLVFCRACGIPVWIVSHKTEYNNFGPPAVNLRQAAMRWLNEQGFFNEVTTGVTPERVFFEATRVDKIHRPTCKRKSLLDLRTPKSRHLWRNGPLLGRLADRSPIGEPDHPMSYRLR